MKIQERKKHQAKYGGKIAKAEELILKISKTSGEDKKDAIISLLTLAKWLKENVPETAWLLKSHRERVKLEIQSIVTAAVTEAENYKKEYDTALEDIKSKMDEIGRPKYSVGKEFSQEEFDKNFQVFNQYVNAMAGTFGEWYRDITVRHDPYDTDWYGTISLRELQKDNNIHRAWYPDETEKDNWCYGALLLNAAMGMRDFARIIMGETRKDMPDYRYRRNSDGRFYESDFQTTLDYLKSCAA